MFKRIEHASKSTISLEIISKLVRIFIHFLIFLGRRDLKTLTMHFIMQLDRNLEHANYLLVSKIAISSPPDLPRSKRRWTNIRTDLASDRFFVCSRGLQWGVLHHSHCQPIGYNERLHMIVRISQTRTPSYKYNLRWTVCGRTQW